MPSDRLLQAAMATGKIVKIGIDLCETLCVHLLFARGLGGGF